MTELKAQLPAKDDAGSEASPHGLVSKLQRQISDLQTQLNTTSHQHQSQAADLVNQVDSLNGKLVESVEKMADLEDTLAVSQHDLEVARAHIFRLEQTAQQHDNLMKAGLLVESDKVQIEMSGLKNKLLEESKQRGKAEKDKQTIESELEELSRSLFEEANKMVVVERVEKANMEKRYQQLESKLGDTEGLLASSQQQLAELKSVLEKTSAEKEILQRTSAAAERRSSISQPPSPSIPRGSRESLTRAGDSSYYSGGSDSGLEAPVFSPGLYSPGPFSPAAFQHDIPPYSDFVSFIESCFLALAPDMVSSPPARPKSPFASPLSSQVNLASILSSNNNSTSSLHSNGATASNNSTVNLNSTLKSKEPIMAAVRDHRFIKRCLTEDVEPTLRLDSAPGLSWLPRRQVLTAIIEGSLVIEPVPQHPSYASTPACTLCGQLTTSGARSNAEYSTYHRFRANEKDGSHPYPVCSYCTSRIRATCDLFVFLRNIRAGHIPLANLAINAQTTPTVAPGNSTPGINTIDRDRQKLYAECVRLREQMFWSRVGVPNISSASSMQVHSGMSNASTADPTSPPPVMVSGPAQMGMMQAMMAVTGNRRPFPHLKTSSLAASSTTSEAGTVLVGGVPSDRKSHKANDSVSSVKALPATPADEWHDADDGGEKQPEESSEHATGADETKSDGIQLERKGTLEEAAGIKVVQESEVDATT